MEAQKLPVDLQKFRKWPEKPEDMFAWRLMIEAAIAELRDMKASLDTDLIYEMQERGIREFKAQVKDMEHKIYPAKERKVTVDTRKMKDMLFSDDPDIAELAKRALAGGQSAWKSAQCKLIADTIGDDSLVQTEYKDKIKLSVIPIQREAQNAISSKE